MEDHAAPVQLDKIIDLEGLNDFAHVGFKTRVLLVVIEQPAVVDVGRR